MAADTMTSSVGRWSGLTLISLVPLAALAALLIASPCYHTRVLYTSHFTAPYIAVQTHTVSQQPIGRLFIGYW